MRKLLYLAIAAGAIALDQLVKWWVRADLPVGGSLPLLDPVLYITHIRNYGAALGIDTPAWMRWVFVVISSMAVLALIFILFVRKPAPGRLPGLPLAFLLAGALGNLIDRIALGYVVDFIDVRGIPFWKWIFNVADICVVCSVVVLAAWMIALELREKRERARGEV